MSKISKITSWGFSFFVIFVMGLLILNYTDSIINHDHSNKKNEILQKSNAFTLPKGQEVKTPVNLCNVIDFGAKPNDSSVAGKNQLAMQKAITSCVDDNHALFIPPGVWFTGGLYFNKNNSWLIVDKEATLSFVYDPELYKPLRPSRFEGYELINFSAPLYFDNLSGGGLTGGGKIKIEEPKKWHLWDKHENSAKRLLVRYSLNATPLEKRIFGKVSDGLRPPFLQLYNVKDFVLDNITIQDSTMWTVHILYSNNVLVQNLNVSTDGSNTDGIVIDSSSQITLKNNSLKTGDDAIVLKSGSDEDGRRVNKPTSEILIEGTVINDAHGAIVIGSEMSGGIDDVIIKDTKITKADIGLRIKTRPGRGSHINNITLMDLQAKNLRNELVRINAHYAEAAGDENNSSNLYPAIKNINITNIATDIASRAITINGLKNYPIENLVLKNITATQKKSSRIFNTPDIKMENVNIMFQEKNDNPIIDLLQNPPL